MDLVTARSERYERPGALPHVLPALIAQDLKRRDFTVNALAVELGSGAFGLLDPLGGGADVARRRLRILHPLSFVEDPTRIFRAARYAARLGFALDAWSARGQALALSLAPYPRCPRRASWPSWSAILADAEPAAALTLLARAGAFRLLEPRYRTDARRPGSPAGGAGDARLDAGARRAGSAPGAARPRRSPPTSPPGSQPRRFAGSA